MSKHEEDEAQEASLNANARGPQPLAGRRILVTRAPHQASELADRLRALGAEPVLLPTIEITAPTSYAALDAALADLASFDLVVFTSANAVAALADRAKHLGIAPAPKRIAAVGPATSRALEAIGLSTAITPPVFTAESLGETLRPEASGCSILLVLAEDAPPTLRDALTAAGAHLTIAHAYSNRIPAASVTTARTLFSNPAFHPDAIAFTSASTARNLFALFATAGLSLPKTIVRASIGPVTSHALAELDFAPQVEARESTIPALVDALCAYFTANRQPNAVLGRHK
jgi:uroporphyrinogen-III synthase